MGSPQGKEVQSPDIKQVTARGGGIWPSVRNPPPPPLLGPLPQIDSSELIRSRELVARSLSTLRASLPPNTVYIYQPLNEDTALPPDTPGSLTSTAALTLVFL